LQVVGVAHWASLPAGKLAEVYGRRALLSRAANQPAASFADWLHATQVLLSSIMLLTSNRHPAKT